jgi:hypothetical protein
MGRKGGGGKHTKRIPWALRRAVSLSRLARVMSFSAMRCASLALCHVVWMDSYLMRDVTKFRSSACRCAELRLRCRYLVRPPAIVGDLPGTRAGVEDGAWLLVAWLLIATTSSAKFLFLAAASRGRSRLPRPCGPHMFLDPGHTTELPVLQLRYVTELAIAAVNRYCQSHEGEAMIS